MTPATGAVMHVKPQPNIYTALVIIAIVFMIVAIAMGLHSLMGSYGMSMKDLFSGGSALSA
jgi:hypothetical protein